MSHPTTRSAFEEGAYLAGIALVASDGGFELVLSDGADIPEAQATLTFFQFLSSATPAFFTQLGLALGLTATVYPLPFAIVD